MKLFAGNRPTKWIVPWALSILPVLAGGMVSHLAAGETPGGEKANPPDARQLSAGEIAEILKIRRALGGPISATSASAQTAPSILSEGEPQAFRGAFHQALQAVKVTPAKSLGTGDSPGQLRAAPQAHAPRPAFVAMRQAARKLDEVAADLEDIGSYRSADRLRGIAASLRLEARTLASPGDDSSSKTE